MADNHLYRIEQLEKGNKEMKDDIKEILYNHLPHIQSDMVRFATAMKIYGGLILAGITALILLGLTP